MWFRAEAMSRGLPRGLDVGADAGSQALELALQPVLEGRPPVVVQQAHLLEHFSSPSGADVEGLLHLDDLGVPDGVAGFVAGQQDDQCPADREPPSPLPAARLAAPPGQVERPGQPRVAEISAGVLVEPGEVPASFE